MRRLFLFASLSAAVGVAIAACSSPKNPVGVPVSGYLNAASGDTAPLTIGNAAGSGFNLDAVIGSANVLATGVWQCFAPDPPQYLNFDLQGTDKTTYGLFISINPAIWNTGSIAIDNTNVALLVSTPDRYGLATSGVITLYKAPHNADTQGNDCSFSVQNVSLYGLRYGNSP